MGEWTPGPWGIEQTPERNWIGSLRSDGKVKEIVCSTDREGLRADVIANNDVNARLIAAAPELVEALREARDCVLECLNAEQMQRTGRYVVRVDYCASLLVRVDAALAKAGAR